MRRLYVLLVSVVIATLLITATTGASAADDQRDPRPKIYGALWVSPSLASSYFATARGDLSAAIQRASSECRGAATDCAPGVWVKNGYVSFAMDITGAWGTGWGKYAPSAHAAAVATCEGFGGVACTVLQTKRTPSYNRLGLTEGGIIQPVAGSGAGGGGAGAPTATASPTATATATASPTATGRRVSRAPHHPGRGG
jgi:hypothetical protein